MHNRLRIDCSLLVITGFRRAERNLAATLRRIAVGTNKPTYTGNDIGSVLILPASTPKWLPYNKEKDDPDH